jgi:hypothetical protein
VNQDIEALRKKNVDRLIAGAVEHLQLEAISSATIKIPGTDRLVVIGSPADVARLLEIAPGVGSPVSTAVGEPVATDNLPPLPEPLEIDWPELHSHALGCGVEDRGIHDRYEAAEYGWQDGVDKAAERVPEQVYDADQMREYARAAIAVRLAAPTQAKPVDLSGLKQYDFTPYGMVYKELGSWLLKSDVECLFAAPTQVSAPQVEEARPSASDAIPVKLVHFKPGFKTVLLSYEGDIPDWLNQDDYAYIVPQASAAQEVRAVPENMRVDLEEIAQSWDGCLVDAVGETMDVGDTLRRQFKQLAVPASTSTAPAAMDEGKWISVAERLPAVGQQVIAYRPTAAETQDPPVKLTRYLGTTRKSWQNVEHGFDCLCHPSHWIPLPAAPTSQPSLDEVTGAGKGETQ